jgi:PST family polysaccharide transporter
LIVSVARRAATGAAWNLGAGIAVRAVGLLGTLVLTRYIAPAQYGEVSVAVVCVLTASRFFTFGLGPFVIARNTDPRETFQCHVTHLAAIGFGCFCLLLLGERLGTALGSPGMVRFVPGLALATILAQASHIPSATLVRSLSFRLVALSRAGGEVTFTVVSVALAPLWGALAIVAGNLARAIVTSTLLIARSNKAEWLHPAPLRWATTRAALAFGVPLTASGLAETLSTSGDNLLMSRLFGPGVMGQYNLGYNLASTPAGQVAEQIGDVLFPSFAKMDAEQRLRALPRAAGLMALLLYPLSAGLAAVSPTLVPTLLDPRWAGLAPMLEILCALALPYPVVWFLGALLGVEGRTKAIMYLSLLKTFLVFGLILLAGRAGPLWACGGVALAFALWGAAFVLTARSILPGLRPLPLLAAAGRPLVASVFMFALVLWLRATAWAGLEPGVLRLVLEVATGGVIYVGMAVLIARPALRELTDLATSVVRGATAGAPRP